MVRNFNPNGWNLKWWIILKGHTVHMYIMIHVGLFNNEKDLKDVFYGMECSSYMHAHFAVGFQAC